MRRTALVLGVAALLAAGGAGVATAATTTTAPDTDPAIARGYYLALNGTSDSGDWAAQSDTLVDPAVGRCYDLTSLATGPAGWTESVNRTDKVALLSASPCAELTEGEQRHAARWTRPDSVSEPDPAEFVFRSVRFASIG